MGCCFSSPSGPNAPYPGGATTPSARAINSQPPLHTAPTDDSSAGSRAPGSTAQSHRSPTGQRHRRRSHLHAEQPPGQALSQHIDKPLRRHRWVSKNRPWTRTALDTERTEFFDTRVTGRPEVWQTIKIALEVLWEADIAERKSKSSKHNQQQQQVSQQTEATTVDSEETGAKSEPPPSEEPDEALATAQGILKAAEVTLPTGNLANGVYDSLGNYYSLPEWIVCDPVNIAEDSGAGAERQRSSRAITSDGADDHGDQSTSELDEDEAERRREEKGKSVAVVKDLVPVRARLSENARDIVVKISVSGSVRALATKITEEATLPSNKRIRVAYMGKILSESTTLQDQGWQKGHIVNAFVFNR